MNNAHSITKIKDLRDALWLDPACADAGACQSRRYREAPPMLTNEQVFRILDSVRAQFVKGGPPTESGALLFARAIERAHGIGNERR